MVHKLAHTFTRCIRNSLAFCKCLAAPNCDGACQLSRSKQHLTFACTTAPRMKWTSHNDVHHMQ